MSGTGSIVILQSSSKHRIAASFAFKQKRSLQLSVQPTLRFLARMAVRYGAVRRYGTPQFLLRSTVRLYCNGTDTLVQYALFVKVRVQYVGTLFELKIPDFSHIAVAFCMQRQKKKKNNNNNKKQLEPTLHV